MNKEQLDFVIEWASICKKQNRIDLHCNVYWDDNSPLEITLYDHKSLKIYDDPSRKEWMNLFKVALCNKIIKVKNASVNMYPINNRNINYIFVSQSAIDKIIEDVSFLCGQR